MKKIIILFILVAIFTSSVSADWIVSYAKNQEVGYASCFFAHEIKGDLTIEKLEAVGFKLNKEFSRILEHVEKYTQLGLICFFNAGEYSWIFIKR